MQYLSCRFPNRQYQNQRSRTFAKNRLVKKAIPLALGDSYKSYRIVGTNQDFATLYNGTLGSGAWCSNDLDVVMGHNVASLTGLKIGDTFSSAHGLSEEGPAHHEHQYHVVGVFKQSNNVLDNLIVTKVESIWAMHEEHGDSTQQETHKQEKSFIPSPLVPSIPKGDSTKEVTSLLIQYRSPMGAVQLPRLVNSQSSLQAASPAFETARLFSILGVGVDVLMGFAYVLIAISALSIFIALYNSLKERRYDLAIMRSMGATRMKLMISILLEGSILTICGSLLGAALGHGVLAVLTAVVSQAQKAGVTGFVFYPVEWIILAASLLLGIVCSLIPAIQAYRVDISKALSKQ